MRHVSIYYSYQLQTCSGMDQGLVYVAPNRHGIIMLSTLLTHCGSSGPQRISSGLNAMAALAYVLGLCW